MEGYCSSHCPANRAVPDITAEKTLTFTAVFFCTSKIISHSERQILFIRQKIHWKQEYYCSRSGNTLIVMLGRTPYTGLFNKLPPTHTHTHLPVLHRSVEILTSCFKTLGSSLGLPTLIKYDCTGYCINHTFYYSHLRRTRLFATARSYWLCTTEVLLSHTQNFIMYWRL
jgi:hypothetical protein